MAHGTLDPQLVLVAPQRLIADSRVAFRARALDLLAELAAQGSPALALDLSATEEVDASGLGMLVLIQKRARDAGLATRLVHPTHSVRSLLALTRLDTLFEIE